MASLTYSAQDEYGNDIIVRLPDWTGQLLLATTATPPDGTLVADGSEVSRASYPELFAKIGTTYGAGDGVTTFALPDWRDEFPRFSGANRAVGTKQGDAIRNATGNTGIRSEANGTAGWLPVAAATGVFSGTGGNHGAAIKTDSVQNFTDGAQVQITFSLDGVVPTADENRPRNVAFLPCIIYV